MMKFKIENKKTLDYFDERNTQKLDIEGFVDSKYEDEEQAYENGQYKSFSKWITEND